MTGVPRPFKKERAVSSTNGAGNLDIHMQKNEVGPYLTPYTKINSKWIKDLNVRSKTKKLLEENIWQNLYNFGFGNDFLDKTPKAEAIKEKLDKLDFMKNLKICASDTINRVQRQPQNGRKYSQIIHLTTD